MTGIKLDVSVWLHSSCSSAELWHGAVMLIAEVCHIAAVSLRYDKQDLERPTQHISFHKSFLTNQGPSKLKSC